MTKKTLALAALLLGACSSSSGTPGGGDGGDGGDATMSEAGAPDAGTPDVGSPDTGGPDTGNPDMGAPDTGSDSPTDSPGDGPPVCNSIGNTAQSLAVDYDAVAPPVAQGGTVVDGTYLMTAVVIDTGVGGPSGPTGTNSQVTLQIAGTTLQIATNGEPSTATATFTTNGTTLTATDSCPDSKVQSVTYTVGAAPVTLTLIIDAGTFSDGGVKTLVETFTKQ
jgi:hypothetical protein